MIAQEILEKLSPVTEEERACCENGRDMCIDYRAVDPVIATDLRLRILGSPKGIEPGVTSFTAFGKPAQAYEK